MGSGRPSSADGRELRITDAGWVGPRNRSDLWRVGLGVCEGVSVNLSASLAQRLRELARFISGEVSGQRYGQFGAPYINTRVLIEAAEALEANVQRKSKA